MTHNARALLADNAASLSDNQGRKSNPHGPAANRSRAAGPPPKPDAKTRVQFDLPPRSMAILTELKDKTDAVSYAEVFKNALKLYDGLVSEVERGSEFLVRDKAGNLTSFRMFL